MIYNDELFLWDNPVNIYLFKVNSRNNRKKVWNEFAVNNNNTRTTSMTFSGVFIVNFKHILHLFSGVSFVDFEQVNVSWEVT